MRRCLFVRIKIALNRKSIIPSCLREGGFKLREEFRDGRVRKHEKHSQ